MIQIGHAIVSLDVIEQPFACNLQHCKGLCCVYGESGAPLEPNEIPILQQIYPTVKQHMTPEGIAAVEQHGVYAIDDDGDLVTPLIGNSEDCAYACRQNSIACCAIEKACLLGQITFRKPVSCHLYPIRITRHNTFEAINYHHWDVCQSAIRRGRQTNTPIYIFLKEPLIRKYGEQWYRQLSQIAEEHNQNRNQK